MAKDKKGSSVIKAIGKGLSVFTPSDENAASFMAWIVPRIKADELKAALYYFSRWQMTGDSKWANLWDPVPGLFLNFSTLNKREWWVRKYGRKWWPYIEKYVANPDWIIKFVKESNADVRAMLDTSLGKSYMVEYSKKLHAFFKMWLMMFPRFHNGCGGVMRYGMIQRDINLYGFYCQLCNSRYTVDQVEANSYQKRIYSTSANPSAGE